MLNSSMDSGEMHDLNEDIVQFLSAWIISIATNQVLSVYTSYQCVAMEIPRTYLGSLPYFIVVFNYKNH